MDPTGIMLFFTFLGIIGVAGLLVAGIGVRRFVREQSADTGVELSTRIRCCGMDALISLFGAGLVGTGLFIFIRVIS